MPITNKTLTIPIPVEPKRYVKLPLPLIKAADYYYTVYAGHYLEDRNKPNYWRICHIGLSINTGVAVANRNARVQILEANDVQGDMFAEYVGPDIPASQSGAKMSLNAGGGYYNTTVVDPATVNPYNCLINFGEIIISGDDYIVLNVNNVQANDELLGFLLLEYLNWDWNNI